MKNFEIKKDYESECNILKELLKKCCDHSPNIECKNQIHFKVSCSICGKSIESISPTEILLKWNKLF